MSGNQEFCHSECYIKNCTDYTNVNDMIDQCKGCTKKHINKSGINAKCYNTHSSYILMYNQHNLSMQNGSNINQQQQMNYGNTQSVTIPDQQQNIPVPNTTQVANQVPNQVPNQVANQVPNQVANQVANPVANQVQTQVARDAYGDIIIEG